MKKLISFALIALSSLPAFAADDLAALCPANLPAAIAAPADQRLRYVVPADGAQIYICLANVAGTTSWTFLAPQANLFQDDALAGTHFIGPVWQANDGSAVKAAKVSGATVDPTAVPWLLLKSVGNVGPGKYANISSIQRVNTVGGIAPAASTCTSANIGAVAQVHYADSDNAGCR
jgi:hypothetical protein